MYIEGDRAVISNPCYEVFPAVPGDQTVCVLGLPRGGTTMVAGVLRRLGIFMGDHLDPTTDEDLAFLGHNGIREIFTNPEREAEKVSYLLQVNETIGRRNHSHPVWGWKDPLSSAYVAEVLHLLRNPHVILVTRDLGASAQREMFQERDAGYPPDHILAHLHGAASAYLSVIGFLATHRLPTLIVSYERALQSPDRTVAGIADFLGVETGDHVQWARQFIRAGAV